MSNTVVEQPSNIYYGNDTDNSKAQVAFESVIQKSLLNIIFVKKIISDKTFAKVMKNIEKGGKTECM